MKKIRDAKATKTKKKIVLKAKKRVSTAKPRAAHKIKEVFNMEPLAVGGNKNSLFLLFRKYSNTSQELHITSGKSDTKFDGASHKIEIIDKKRKKENISICSDFRFSLNGKIVVMTYTRNTESGNSLVYAESADKKKWVIKDVISKIKTAGIVSFDEKKKIPHIYFGDHVLRIARSKKQKTKAMWEIVEPPRAPHWNFFDGVPFSVFGGLVQDDHFAVFYSAEHIVDIMRDVNLRDEKIGEERLLKIGVAIFAKKEPTRLLWQTELPILEVPLDTIGNIRLLGIVKVSNKPADYFRVYTSTPGGEMGYFDLPNDIISDHKDRKQILLKKWKDNPILSPTHLDWEVQGAFNPTALHLNDKVHLLYRAIGNDGMSRIGYASSHDGLNIHERLPKPIYSPHNFFEKNETGQKPEADALMQSGGGWGGCEDPKVTQIGDRIYMTYVAFDGSWPTRTVLTSISVDDFLNKRWRWAKPQLMSAPGVGSKSVVFLPEMIDGNYYIFHRRWPNIMLDIVPDLEFGDGKKWLTGEHMIRPRKSFWDSRKLSVGSTPIKTKEGWLTIYNAVDRLDSSKYKIGAMLLDLKNPEKVLARGRRPILSPEEFYENDGKPGVAYPGGAVDLDGMLHVYYGGGDKVCCVAQIPTEELVWHLMKDSEPVLKINKLR